jgi:hypothetical protein
MDEEKPCYGPILRGNLGIFILLGARKGPGPGRALSGIFPTNQLVTPTFLGPHIKYSKRTFELFAQKFYIRSIRAKNAGVFPACGRAEVKPIKAALH